MLSAITTSTVIVFLLALARAAGLMVFAPALGHHSLPWMVRLPLAAAIAMAATMHGMAGGEGIATAGAMLSAAVAEFVIGIAIGYAAAAVLAGVETGAAYISQQAGVALLPPAAGEDGQGDPVSRLYALLAVVVFVSIGGHRDLIAALMHSYQAMPAGAYPAGIIDNVVQMLSAGMLLAIKIAAPVVTAMLAATIVLGLLQRILPQLNILSSGLPLRVLAGLALIAAAAGLTGRLTETAVRTVLR